MARQVERAGLFGHVNRNGLGVEQLHKRLRENMLAGVLLRQIEAMYPVYLAVNRAVQRPVEQVHNVAVLFEHVEHLRLRLLVAQEAGIVLLPATGRVKRRAVQCHGEILAAWLYAYDLCIERLQIGVNEIKVDGHGAAARKSQDRTSINFFTGCVKQNARQNAWYGVLVPPARLERATCGLEVRCSIH